MPVGGFGVGRVRLQTHLPRCLLTHGRARPSFDPRNTDRYREGVERLGEHGAFELPEDVRLRHFEPARIGELLSAFDEVSHQQREFMTMNGDRARGIQLLGRLSARHR